MERTGQCHYGSLRVIATGEPDRVYLCHFQACQRGTGTAFHFWGEFSQRTCPARRRAEDLRARRRQRLTHPISFSARIAAPPFIAKGTATQRSAESQWVHLTRQPFHRPATRFGRSRCICGLACRQGWTIISRAGHRLHESRAQSFDHHKERLRTRFIAKSFRDNI